MTDDSATRFPLRIDAIYRPFLLAGGATRRNSYAELTDRGIDVRFGWDRRTVPYEDIKAVFPRSWPFLYGIGWRSNLRGVIGLVGSYEGVVEVRMKRRRRAWLLFPWDRLALSLEDPLGFIAAVEERARLSLTLRPSKGRPEPAARAQRPRRTRRRS